MTKQTEIRQTAPRPSVERLSFTKAAPQRIARSSHEQGKTYTIPVPAATAGYLRRQAVPILQALPNWITHRATTLTPGSAKAPRVPGSPKEDILELARTPGRRLSHIEIHFDEIQHAAIQAAAAEIGIEAESLLKVCLMEREASLRLFEFKFPELHASFFGSS